MKKTLLLFFLLAMYFLPVRAQSIIVGFDHNLLPDTNMDYTMTIDTGNYWFNPDFDNWNETKLYGRKEADSSYTGFTYSNVKDSITSGKINDRAAYPAIGADNSPQYGIAHGIDNSMRVDLYIGVKPTIQAHVYHLYVTNATITALSMEHGDSTAKKFGGLDGTDPDWLMLTIKGYEYYGSSPDSLVRMDSLQVYLADFRSPDSTADFILKEWKQIDLEGLGRIDSLSFHLSSSDTDSTGMKTPAYFCVDNFAIQFVGNIESNGRNTLDASVYPNPVKDVLQIRSAVPVQYMINSISGMGIKSGSGKQIDVSNLATGLYVIKVLDEKSQRSSSFTFRKVR